METGRESFVAECFWPGVTGADVEALDRRVRAATAAADGDGGVRYLGSLLMLDDEVVLCEFEGRADAVRLVAEQAGVPFERLLRTTSSTTRYPTRKRRTSR